VNTHKHIIYVKENSSNHKIITLFGNSLIELYINQSIRSLYQFISSLLELISMLQLIGFESIINQ